ncbi:vacuolar protein-sorting-associated protein 36-like [Mytilus californianus]|uniref:vacuolar protein-sorting-associated protein 36-like n=1 Tax=Mytilus californianus TaxID=6549 RepID=UPI002245CE61|nr:vacuolar protein-sorting-associated protein 36-like [Mytilus californianus]
MDRWEWCESDIFDKPGESFVCQQAVVSLYDGEDKSTFVHGLLTLTTHRLQWKDPKNRSRILSLPLSLVVFLEQEAAGFSKSAKIVVHLNSADSNKPAGPNRQSRYNYIKLSFKQSGEREFFRELSEQLQQKRWQQSLPPAQPVVATGRHRGIMGIERSIQQKQKATDSNITQSFQDLSKLIEKAKEMVALSKTIATKIKDKQGDITEDETVKFKSYLLSMGIPNPVTRETHGTGDKYNTELAKELSKALMNPLKESGGIMTLTDVYCRVNRARGMELLSPEDLINACEMLEILRLPVRLKTFDSGVMVLQLQSHDEEQIIKDTTKTVEENQSMTSEELSQNAGISVILAKERLLLTEKVGGVCRDESVEGLRFYPNLFLTKCS